MRTALHRMPVRALHPVCAPEELEDLARRAGDRGHVFLIAGADRLAYRLRWRPVGVEVARLDDRGRVLHARHLPLDEFLDHPVLEALHAGQLFTARDACVPRPG